MTKEGIQADLQAMNDVGIGGVLMMNVYPTPPLNIECMGERWWELLTYANEEAKKQDILFGTHNCPGWSTSGGPWTTVENSMQKVVFTETELAGPGRLETVLPQAEVDPRWSYYRDIVVYAIKDAKRGSVPREHVIDVSTYMDEAGTLRWDAPAGAWTIYRFGHTTTGHMNGPPIKGGQGLECDKMSREATKIHFDSYAKKIIDRMKPLVGDTLNNFELDSYEAGKQNWTPKYREEFLERRGYDPLPWFPVLAGVTVGDADQTARFNRDMAKTISDLFVENHYEYLTELMNENGVTMDYEAYGGPFDPLAAGGAADMPMGECWTGPMGWGTVTLAVSAAHTHGRPVIGCEALTSTPMHSQWKQTPYSVKAFADRAFAMGINMMVLHCYAQQPWMDQVPGMSMNFWGTHFSRTNTWWDYSRPWFDYLARCQYILQQGMPVVDLLKLSTNTGHIPRAPGYKTDLCNEETLARMTVKDGYLVLPDGMRYRVLLLPDDGTMSLPALQEIERLVLAGATVAGPKPQRVPGLTNFPDNDRLLQELADTIWGPCDGKEVKENTYGQGLVLTGLSVPEVMSRIELAPAVSFTEARSGFGTTVGVNAVGIEFNHRMSKGMDIFFVSNQEDCFREIDASFRVAGKQAFFLDPATGTAERAPIYHDTEGRTQIPLRLAPSEACFVVFQGARTSQHLVDIVRKGSDAEVNGDGLEPVRVYMAQGISQDRKHVTDLTAEVQALAHNGMLRITPKEYAALVSGVEHEVARITVDYLVEDDRRMSVTIPHGTIQIPHGVPLSDGPAYDLAQNASGQSMLNVWESGEYQMKWSNGAVKNFILKAALPSIDLNDDWTVAFEGNRAAPEFIELDTLQSLSEHPDAGVKYFSGTSTYSKSFTVDAQFLSVERIARLDLGKVKSLARVHLNGHDLGILWKPPFRMDITEHLRAGENQLVIRVANTWPNRMIGDEQEPDDCQWSHIISWPHSAKPDPVGRSLRLVPDWVINQEPRPSQGRVTFSNWKYFDKDTPLLESGLIGPVSIRAGLQVEL